MAVAYRVHTAPPRLDPLFVTTSSPMFIQTVVLLFYTHNTPQQTTSVFWVPVVYAVFQKSFCSFPSTFPLPILKPLACSPAPQAVFNHPSQEQHTTCPLSCSAALQSSCFYSLETGGWKSVFPSPETAGTGPKEVPGMQLLCACCLWLNCVGRLGYAEGLHSSLPATAVMPNMFWPLQGFVPSVRHSGDPKSRCGCAGCRFPICATSEMANAAEKETTQCLGLWGVDALCLPLPWQAEVMRLQARGSWEQKQGWSERLVMSLARHIPLPWAPRWLMHPLHSNLELFPICVKKLTFSLWSSHSGLSHSDT